MSFSVTVNDWLYCRKLGCKLSYAGFRQLHAQHHENVKRVVEAWCAHLARKQ